MCKIHSNTPGLLAKETKEVILLPVIGLACAGGSSPSATLIFMPLKHQCFKKDLVTSSLQISILWYDLLQC